MTPRGNRRGTGPASPYAAAVHEQIRLQMTKRRMNQNRLAEATGISRNRISKTISLDEAPVTVNELDLIAESLKIEASVLLARAERALDLSATTPTVITDDDIDVNDWDLAADQHKPGDEPDYDSY